MWLIRGAPNCHFTQGHCSVFAVNYFVMQNKLQCAWSKIATGLSQHFSSFLILAVATYLFTVFLLEHIRELRIFFLLRRLYPQLCNTISWTFVFQPKKMSANWCATPRLFDNSCTRARIPSRSWHMQGGRWNCPTSLQTLMDSSATCRNRGHKWWDHESPTQSYLNRRNPDL